MDDCTDEGRWCHFHPREMVVGVCALCLNERLLLLASKEEESKTSYSTFTPRKLLPKIFNLLKNSDNINLHRSEVYDDHHHSSSSPCSPEDSFISIKFEENGVASWDKDKISQISHDHQKCEVSNLDMNKNKNKNKIKIKIKSVIEHSKPRASLKWRRPIGQLFHLIKWKRSSKGKVCHVGTNLEKEKVKYGWIRILTRRKAKE